MCASQHREGHSIRWSSLTTSGPTVPHDRYQENIFSDRDVWRHGRDAVATFLLSSRRFLSEPDTSYDFATINASPGLILRESGRPLVVMTFEIEDSQIRVLRLVANPDKLTHVDRATT